MKRFIRRAIFILTVQLLLSSCGSGGSASAPSTAKAIKTFSFSSPTSSGVIDENTKTISVTVPYGTDVTALVALFTTTGASVKVASKIQTSGTTINDYTNPVSYLVTAVDGSTATYIVAVTVKANVIDLPKTGQTASYAAGDDGTLQKGITWPNPRFTLKVSGSGTIVTDNLTSLMWPQDAGAPTVGLCNGGTSTWQGALSYISCLNANNYLGYADWRLPNVNELESLVNLGQANNANWLMAQGFVNVSGDSGTTSYWSSTTYVGNSMYAWSVGMGTGWVGYVIKDNSYIMTPIAWPVRGGQRGTLSILPKTGQASSYTPGDDGSLQDGAGWPNPRFTNTDGSIPISSNAVLDRLTGLVWTKDGNAPGPEACGPAVTKTWQGAMDYVACLNTNNYLGYNDWRLPNRKELRSLVSAGQNWAWLNGEGFINEQTSDYWSATTYSSDATYAWLVGLYDGYVYVDNKTKNFFSVWPVRGGL